jgi:hypothetical protein
MKTIIALLAGLILLQVESGAGDRKPVFLYSRYFNARGEDRYLPEGTYKDVLQRLGKHFEVRVNEKPLTEQNLMDVDVVLVANPSDEAVAGNLPPHHVDERDIAEITKYLEQGGGLIVMGNQENHNLEIRDMNKLLGRFGIQFTNVYTDAKKLVLGKQAPIISSAYAPGQLLGEMRWAYYTGNQVLLDASNKANPQPVVINDLRQKPEKGERDAAGVLMASATPGKGRLLVVTDSGWITNTALSGEGIGGVAIKEQDNWSIFDNLALWAAACTNESNSSTGKNRERQ